MPRNGICIALLLLALGTPVQADVSLPAIFGDHMVLQRDETVPVWGTAAPGEAVTVTVGAASGSATAGSDGKWRIDLSGLLASSTPLDVTVQGKNKIVFHDVLVGDVWLCSGQSNMNFPLRMEASAAREIPAANHPLIRLFVVPERVCPTPQEDLIRPPSPMANAHWLLCTPETVPGFTAVGYYFGKKLQETTAQPIGLIKSAFSGTPGEAWTSLEALQAVPALKSYANSGAAFRRDYDALLTKYTEAQTEWQADLDAWKAAHSGEWEAYQAAVDARKKNPAAPAPKPPIPPPTGSPNTAWKTSSVLFNGMIAPIIPYAIKGVAWYQGEGNAISYQAAIDYAVLLPTLISDWRTRWGRGDFPFLIVQIASWNPPRNSSATDALPYARESQMKTLSLPKTGLETTVDIGEANNLHPTDKADLGERLALAARRLAYGEDIVASGPVFKEATPEGSSLRLTFESLGQGLEIGSPPPGYHAGEPRPPAEKLLGFAIAGSDGAFVDADAVIDGTTVLVSSTKIVQPVFIRYDWEDVGTGNLYNKDGLPALPFRTDTFPPPPGSPALEPAP